MNQYQNQRGFGGPPQPQRQGGRARGNRGGGGGPGGGFRTNSRFDHNQTSQNPPGDQRPQNETPAKASQPAEKPQVQPNQTKPQNQPKPQNPTPQKPQTPAQNAPAQPVQQQPKPAQITPSKTDSKDIVDKAAPEQKTPQVPQPSQPQQQNRGGPQQSRPNSQQQPQPQQPRPNSQQQQQPRGNNPQQQQPRGNNPQQQQPRGNNPQQQQNLLQQNQQQQNQHQQNRNEQQQNQQQWQQQHQRPGQQQQNNMNGSFGGNRQGGWGQGRRDDNRQQQGGNFGGPGGPPRNQRGGPRNQQHPIKEEHILAMKLKDLQGPILELPHLELAEVKFNGRSRLYIGNLTSDVTEEEILTMFGAYGETAELFLNKEKMFGFIKMDYRVNAERAKHELDGKMRNGKTLRVRIAPHNSAIRVKNLPPFVSNELLYCAFEIFGKIEKAYVKVDERGKSLGEGVVEYMRKPSALAAIRNCTDKCFFLTSSLRPVIVESFEEPDELDGYPEKNLPKKHPEFLQAREMGPRFAEPGSFEHEYGTRWKQLHELHRQKEEALKKELAAEEEKLEAQMEYAKYEHETEMLREQLRQREQDRERQKRTWEMAERAAEERREAERAALLRQEEELSTRMRHQDDELRRRQQENTLFVQAQRLTNLLDRQEQGAFDQPKPMEGGFNQYDRGSYDDMPGQGQSRGGWEPRQMDDYPSKRRRF